MNRTDKRAAKRTGLRISRSDAEHPESVFKAQLVKRLRQTYGWAYPPSDKFIYGVPDILVLVDGTLYGIELKLSKWVHRVSEIQALNLACIVNNGGVGIVFVADNKGGVRTQVESFMRWFYAFHKARVR